MSSKRKLIIGSSVIIFIVVIAAITVKSLFFTKGFHITVKNNTNTTISGLKITYKNINKDIDLKPVEPNKKISINVLPNEDFGENVMRMYYFDKQGNIYENVIVGYFEKGYSGKVNIDINAIDSYGELKLKIK